jgi:iron complex outermembrane receptor protein
MKMKTLVGSLALLGLATHALAQTSGTAQRVVITGSSIKRIQAEGALPMDVYTADEMARTGIQTAEQLVQSLAANGISTDSEISNNNVFGQDTDRLTGGANYANLRGLGASGTLVLINGRRVATHGMSGGAVDLNAIPTAAVARVEVLRDGASAIYGADAIGGVMNFILKTDLQGVRTGLSYKDPLAKGGGTERRLWLAAGNGSLERDGFNVMGALSIDENDILRGKDRDFVDGFQPERGLSPDSSSHPFANIFGAAGTALPAAGSVVSPTDPTKYTRINLLALPGQAGCEAIDTGVPYQGQLWNVPAARAGMLCNTDYGRQSMLSAAKRGYNFAGRGVIKLGSNAQAFVELLDSRTTVYSEFVPAQFGGFNNFTLYPVNGPHYLNLKDYGVVDFDPTMPIRYRWRMQDFGLRKILNVAENTRVAIGAEGDWGAYFYRLGASMATSDAWRELIDGYAYTKKLKAALDSGIINPWVLPGQTQTQEAKDLIESTKARGRLDGGQTTMSQVDASISGPLFKLPGGEMSFAVGADLRHETYEFAMEEGGFNCVSSIATATPGDKDVLLCPGNSAVPTVSRDVNAVYAELQVPVFKSLDVQLALRHDEYSGSLGGTTNPKVAFLFRPMKQLMFRGSYNTGFRAPSFQQMIANTAPRDLTFTVNDPLADCTNPGGADLANPLKCGIGGLDFTSGGDPNLKPETSKQAALGIVLAPIPSLTLTADYWRIDMEDRIRTLTVSQILADHALYSHLVVRDADGNISLINSGWINAADSSTVGIDWSINWSTKWAGASWTADVSGTHMLKAEERANAALPMEDFVGKFNTRTIYLKDKINASLSWERGDWRATGTALYKSGYMDQNMNTTAWKNTVADPNNEMGPLTIYGLYVRYNGIKNTSVQVGVSNLFDTKPPFSHHNVDDVAGAGYDPRYASPVGRAVHVTASYTF